MLTMNESNDIKETIFNPNHATITFRVKYQTKYGQEVRIVGNIEELGSWEPTKAILMTTTKDTYPYWVSTQEVLGPVGMEIYYKYVIYDRPSNKYIWESFDNSNRFFAINLPGFFELNDEEGNKKCEVKRLNGHDVEAIDIGDDMNQSDDCDFTKYSLIQHEIYDILNYDSVKMETSQINKIPLMDLTLKIVSDDRIIIASAHLPFEIERLNNNSYQLKITDENLIYTTMFGIKEKHLCEVVWIGMLKNFNKFTEDELNDIYDYLKERNIYMVVVDDQKYKNYWIYINQILRVVFIHIDIRNDYFYEYEDYFEAYSEVSHQFCCMIANVMQKNDMIMINDIHLMLIPHILLQKNPNARVGIYFHSAFPSSDSLKTFPYHQEILKSILLCDVIGFHVFQNARNFLTAIQRFFGIFYDIKIHGMLVLEYLGRTIIIHVSHAGLDIDYIRNIVAKDDFKYTINQYRCISQGKYTLVSIDNLNSVPGLIIKIEAYKRFLSKHSELLSKITFIQIIKGGRDDEISKFNYLKQKTDFIKKEYGFETIYLEMFESFSVEARFALFAIADCLFYLVSGSGNCMEYIAVQGDINRASQSNIKFGMILSENIGVSSALKGVLTVNPYDVFSITKGIETVFNMSDDQKMFFFNKDNEYIRKNNILKWIKSFLIDLKRLTEGDASIKIGIGIGLNFRLMRLNSKFNQINKNNFLETYRQSSKRMIFLDYEGTLQVSDSTDKYSDPKENMPSQSLIHLLNSLTEDSKNRMYIVSGRERRFVNEWFSAVPNIGLAAEYGFFYKLSKEHRKYDEDQKNDNFIQLFQDSDWSWKDYAIKILQGFTEKTEGSYITEKETMLSWIYKDCDVYFGRLQANEIKTHLENTIDGASLIITNGKGYVDIKPRNVNKGSFISHIIKQEFIIGDEPDFILAIGDEQSDEEMFKYLNYIQEKMTIKSEIKIYTFTIGRKPSEARYYLNNTNEVFDYLEAFNQISHANLHVRQRSNGIFTIDQNDYSRRSNKSDTYSGGVQSMGFNI